MSPTVHSANYVRHRLAMDPICVSFPLDPACIAGSSACKPSTPFLNPSPRSISRRYCGGKASLELGVGGTAKGREGGERGAPHFEGRSLDTKHIMAGSESDLYHSRVSNAGKRCSLNISIHKSPSVRLEPPDALRCSKKFIHGRCSRRLQSLSQSADRCFYPVHVSSRRSPVRMVLA